MKVSISHQLKLCWEENFNYSRVVFQFRSISKKRPRNREVETGRNIQNVEKRK